jgi:hypothetical protein
MSPDQANAGRIETPIEALGLRCAAADILN